MNIKEWALVLLSAVLTVIVFSSLSTWSEHFNDKVPIYDEQLRVEVFNDCMDESWPTDGSDWWEIANECHLVADARSEKK